MKQTLFALLTAVSLVSCTKTEQAPDPKFYDGTTLGVNVHKATPVNAADTVNTGHVVLMVNGTSGNGQVITTQVNFDNSNHVAFSVVIRAIDFEANEYDFNLNVPAGVNQIDTVFNAGGRVQVL